MLINAECARMIADRRNAQLFGYNPEEIEIIKISEIIKKAMNKGEYRIVYVMSIYDASESMKMNNVVKTLKESGYKVNKLRYSFGVDEVGLEIIW